jgi:hypothetical protein
MAQNNCKKHVSPNYIHRLKVTKMCKLQIFVVTNVRKPIFVTFWWDRHLVQRGQPPVSDDDAVSDVVNLSDAATMLESI